jgi:hypothetical protein
VTVFCDRCGANVPERAAFCSNCGKPSGVVPLVPAQGRIAGHVRLLGIFWLALSVFRLIPGIAMLTIFGHAVDFPGVPYFVNGILSSVGWVFIAAAVLGIIAGYGLIQREPWARMLAIIMGVISLLEMPFGTALGVYTLWVLLPAKSEREYSEVSRAA